MEYFSFQWHITDECDQRCKHCYIFSEDTCKVLDAMTWEQTQKTFYSCLDFCEVYGRLPYFYITDGDPILHPDFWRLCGLLKEHGIPFAILGNPFHLTDEVCRRPKEKRHTSALLSVGLSLLSLLIFGAENFIIPAMLVILAALTGLRGRLEKRGDAS